VHEMNLDGVCERDRSLLLLIVNKEFEFKEKDKA
jgi:hypothetical protein